MQKFDAMTGSPSAPDYATRFCFDEDSPASVSFSLMRAYDNAIVLRDEISTETFSYIQLAVYEMKNAARSHAPLLPLQKVLDNIAAFWGMADDRIDNEHVRGIIKLGKRIERVDLYARMNAGAEEIRREIRRLSYRVRKAGLNYSLEGLARLEAAASGEIDPAAIIREVEALITFAG
jgi:uncharacterized alpha-E superfamily protein